MNADLFDSDCVRQLVWQLEEKERLPFMMRLEDKVFDSAWELCYSVQFLKPEDRLPYISRHHAIIKDDQDLHFIFRILDEHDCTAFAVKFKDRIGDGIYLGEIISHLPEADKLPYAIQHQMKLTCYHDLAYVLPGLREEDRFAFALSNSARFEIGNFSAILHLLPVERQLEFASANTASIKDVFVLNDVLERITLQKDRFAFALTRLAGGPSAEELSCLMRHLSDEYRLEFSILAQAYVAKRRSTVCHCWLSA